MIRHINAIIVYAKHRPLIWDTIFTTIWGAIGNAAGFFIPIFIAAYFGVTKQTDAFFLAYSLVFLIANIFSQTLETVVVPFITQNKQNNENIDDFIGSILTTGTITFSFLIFIFLFLIKPILYFTKSFPTEDLNLVYTLSIEIVPFAILMVVASVLSGSINAFKIFAIPAVSPAIRATIVVLFIISLSEKIGISAIALGYVVGEFCRVALLIIFIKKAQLFNIRLSLVIDPNLIKLLKTSSYLVIGMFFTSTIPLINKLMASWTGEGNVSLLEYAEKIFIIPIVLLNSGLVTTILSHWSERYYSAERDRFNSDVKRTLKIAGLIGLFFSILFYFIREFLINFIYGYAKFTLFQFWVVDKIFVCYLIGITPYLLAIIYTRAFLTIKNTKVLLIVSLFMTLATFLFNFILVELMGVVGIALSNSLVIFLTYVILAVIFSLKERGYGRFKNKNI